MKWPCLQYNEEVPSLFLLSCLLYEFPFKAVPYHFERGVLFHSLSHSSDTNTGDQREAGEMSSGSLPPSLCNWRVSMFLLDPVMQDSDSGLSACQHPLPGALSLVSLGVTAEPCPLVLKVLVRS